jgi:hypothetical protein
MNTRIIVCITVMVFCACCSTQMTVTRNGAPNWSVNQLEVREQETTPEGEDVLRVGPNVESRDELMMYRELKIAEAAEILAITEEASKERPYYPAIITLAQPLTLAQFNELVAHYNPSIQKSLSAMGSSKSAQLGKAELVKGVDKLVVNAVRFNSTNGKGQLSYDTMADGEQLASLEEGLAAKEQELNQIEDYQLVAGITSLVGGVHRDDVLSLHDDSRVFLADIGPIDLYEGSVDYALWDDVSDLVAKYLNH